MVYIPKIKFQKTYKGIHNAREKHIMYLFYTDKEVTSMTSENDAFSKYRPKSN